MTLITATGLAADRFARAGGEGAPLVGLDGLEAALAASNEAVGVEVANTVTIETLAPYLGRVALIAIAFPAFSDGRGFTLARRLRRAGFAGTLRAVGPLIADQFSYALACGFDEVELPEASAARQPVAQWLAAAGLISATYQRGYQAGGNILDQRRAARRGTAG